MSMATDPVVALGWVIRIAACGVLIDSVEKLVCWPVFHHTGVLSWSWLRLRRGFLQRGWCDAMLGFPVYMAMLALRAVAALLLVIYPLHVSVSALGLPVIVLTSLCTHLRMAPYGLHGAHRMTLVIFGALLLWRMAPASLVVAKATLWFIALQGCLSYATAGWVKAFIPAWRQGTGAFAIINVPWIGPEWLARWLHHHPLVTKAVTWLTLGMECAFPFVLVIGYPGNLVFISWGLLFHCGNALILGLNTFVWAWIATYPALVYVTASGV
jgi:hypothetical protein